ncbi:hypothetical protein M0805_007069 [Coniferiporia weirii]|nr:hypothetical protein M0805_007069 [Coniferiporia weirii]
MQCIWTPLSDVRRATWQAIKTANRSVQRAQCRNFSLDKLVGRDAAEEPSKKARFTSLAHAFVSTAIRDTSIPPSPLPVVDLPQPSSRNQKSPRKQKRYTAAQLSRAAAQSVRLAFQQNGVHEASLILQSLRGSVIQYRKGRQPDKSALEKVAIDFGQAVSPRLAVHCFLHELVRSGMAQGAGTYAWRALRSHLRIHPRTLRLITETLCKEDIQALHDDGFRTQIRLAKEAIERPGKRPQKIGWQGLQAPRTRLAAQLFFAAKQYQRQRAKQMFQQLIDACLLQGEIIVVSFLFAFLVKQWQVRLTRGKDGPEPESEIDVIEKSGVLSGENARGVSIDNLPPVENSFMAQMLRSINSAIFNTPLPESQAIQPTFEEAAQALAILADMLTDDALPFESLSSLISTLVSFPSTPPVKVWVHRDGQRHLKVARKYFDEVLDSLVEKAISDNPPAPGHGPELGRLSRSTILHYALRRKLSPALGERVFNQMLAKGGRNKPDIATYNILLRSGTLFRRNDISEKVLGVLRGRPENFDHSIMYEPSHAALDSEGWEMASHPEDEFLGSAAAEEEQTGEVQSPDLLSSLHPAESDTSTGISKSSESSKVPPESLIELPIQIQRILSEDFDPNFVISPDSELRADGITLTSYISYLTATSNPEVVSRLIFFLIPELQVVDHPAYDVEARKLRRQQRAMDKRVAVQRAIALGPYFFTSVLNALVKARQTGIAERVWLLAKQAERLSWDPQFAGATQPWALPIAAYTIMMQCYAAEARKGLDMRYLSQGADRHGGADDWTPKHHGRVKGWALFVLKRARRKKTGDVNPLEAGREMGSLLFRSMQAGGQDIYEQLMSYMEREGKCPPPKNIRLPIPDERFFNAALDLFGRYPGMYVREVKENKARWKRLNGQALEHFVKFGHVNYPRDPMLVNVVQEMHKAGFEVPEAFKRMLIGQYVPPPGGDPSQNRQKSSPYSVKRNQQFTPHQLPTAKSRGLPVRKGLKIGKIPVPSPPPPTSNSSV